MEHRDAAQRLRIALSADEHMMAVNAVMHEQAAVEIERLRTEVAMLLSVLERAHRN
jgi:hypothetical protein